MPAPSCGGSSRASNSRDGRPRLASAIAIFANLNYQQQKEYGLSGLERPLETLVEMACLMHDIGLNGGSLPVGAPTRPAHLLSRLAGRGGPVCSARDTLLSIGSSVENRREAVVRICPAAGRRDC